MLLTDSIQQMLIACTVLVLIILIVVLAWFSTKVPDEPLMTTAFVVFQRGENTDVSYSSAEEATQTTIANSLQDRSSQHLSESDIDSHSSGLIAEVSSNDESLELIRMMDDDISNNTCDEVNGRSSDSLFSSEERQNNCTVKSDILLVNSVSETVECQNESSDAINTLTKQSEDINACDSSVTNVCDSENQSYGIRIRLKFFDETQKLVYSQLEEKVGIFKREHFGIDLDSDKVVRLIFNGQLLSQDSFTLGQYGLFDNCVLHCHVSQSARNFDRQQGENGVENGPPDLSSALIFILWGVVAVLWFLRYEYGYLFNTSATVLLAFLTILLLLLERAMSFSVSIRIESRRQHSNSTPVLAQN